MKRILLSAMTALLLNMGTACADSFDDGVAAYGRGDYATAVEKFQPLAYQGNSSAQYNLGQMYREGKGIVQDYVAAAKWYRLAAAQGYVSAQYSLGVTYDRGRGVAQDYAEAVKWYRLAAEQRHAGAQLNLGVMYGQGKGATQDYVLAHMWSNLAGSTGNSRAIEFRDLIAQLMNPQQMAQAQQMARDCQKRNFKGCD